MIWISGLSAVEIGDYSTWVQGGLSDHVPLTVEMDDAVIGLVDPGAVDTPRTAGRDRFVAMATNRAGV